MKGLDLLCKAFFFIIHSPDVDCAPVNWADLTQYKYRHESIAGHHVAQEEFDPAMPRVGR